MEVPVGDAQLKTRCAWAGSSELYQAYHDNEWGVPQHAERDLFEFLILEGAQAGLSWITILKKRDAYREVFDRFNVELVARYDEHKIAELMQNAAIVRNRLKLNSAVINAQKFIAVQDEFGSFDAFIWRFVEGETMQNNWRTLAEIPASTPTSDAMSKELKRRGFKFVGSTICYALMQATGMVNDHTTDCFRHAQLKP
jgi:DNA-3-methyladenine glycosylase I